MCDPAQGSYLRLIDSCISHLKAQGPSKTCNESKEEEEEEEEDPAQCLGSVSVGADHPKPYTLRRKR